MKSSTQGRSLASVLKQIPPQSVSCLHSPILLLVGLAIAEAYELLGSGTINTLAHGQDGQDSLQRALRKAGLTLNERYAALVPEPWLVSESLPKDAADWSDAVLRKVADALIDVLDTHLLDAQQLGHAHEILLGQTGAPVPNDDPIVPQMESFFSQGQKCQGAYYTPSEIVDYMVAETIHPVMHQGATFPTVLDPACGGGAFLWAAYREVLRIHADVDGRSPTLDQRIQILQRSIYGVDLDAQAIRVARFVLHLECLRGHRVEQMQSNSGDLSERQRAIATTLTHNLQQGNALIAEGPHGLNWDTSFPEITADGGFDVVVGNPPYLDSERMTEWMPQWRSYCTKHYETAQGNWDLFCIFIEKAVMLCKPGGYHSFIVPNKLASATYATAVRSLLFQQSTLLSVRDYSQTSAFSAAVYPLVYVVQKRRSPPSVSTKPFSTACSELFSEMIPSSSLNDPHALIRYEQMGSDLNIAENVSRLPRAYFSRPQMVWLLGHQTARAAIALKLSQQFPPLEAIAEVQGAASVSEAYALKPLIHDHQGEGLSSDVFPLVNSGTLDRYHALWGVKPLKYLGDRYTTPVVAVQNLSAHFPRRYEQAIAPKIIVAGMTKRLECVADVTGGILAGKSTSIIRPSGVPLLYLLGILNSTLIHHMVLQHFSSNSLQGGYLRIGPPQLRTLPIAPQREDLGDRLIHHVQHILHLLSQARGLSPNSEENASLHRHIQKNIQKIDTAIDQIVFQLYQLSQEEIEALLKAELTR